MSIRDKYKPEFYHLICYRILKSSTFQTMLKACQDYTSIISDRSRSPVKSDDLPSDARVFGKSVVLKMWVFVYFPSSNLFSLIPLSHYLKLMTRFISHLSFLFLQLNILEYLVPMSKALQRPLDGIHLFLLSCHVTSNLCNQLRSLLFVIAISFTLIPIRDILLHL